MAKHHGSLHASFLRVCVLMIGLLRALAFGFFALLHPSSRERWFSEAKANLNLARLETNYDG